MTARSDSALTFAKLRAILLIVVATSLVGCDVQLSPAQRFQGMWTGRVERAQERVHREWPAPSGGAEAAAEVSSEEDRTESEPTDLERIPPLEVTLDFSIGGSVRMVLDGQEIQGSWTAIPMEGQRVVLEIDTRSDGAAGGERRRFDVEFLEGDDRFVMREEGSDSQFGRLIFERPGQAP